MRFVDAGRVSYETGLRLQGDSAERLRAGGGETVFLLEHDPVYTIGRLRDKTSLRDATHLPHPVFEVSRGGQATYHGPGQLVAYPVLDLQARGRDLHLYLRNLESVLIDVLAGFGLTAERSEGRTGVWVAGRKIASIGVGVRRWVTLHGLALNVGPDLSGFDRIVPCGLSGVVMTSLSREVGRDVSVEDVKRVFPDFFRSVFEPVTATTAPNRW